LKTEKSSATESLTSPPNKQPRAGLLAVQPIKINYNQGLSSLEKLDIKQSKLVEAKSKQLELQRRIYDEF